MTLIRGAGGGGKGGGGGGGGSARTPTEADDSLQSVQHAKVLDLIAEGPIQGLDNQTYPLNSIFLDAKQELIKSIANHPNIGHLETSSLATNLADKREPRIGISR